MMRELEIYKRNDILVSISYLEIKDTGSKLKVYDFWMSKCDYDIILSLNKEEMCRVITLYYLEPLGLQKPDDHLVDMVITPKAAIQEIVDITKI